MPDECGNPPPTPQAKIQSGDDFEFEMVIGPSKDHARAVRDALLPAARP